MGSRIELQQKLEAVLGSRNVYFQPPETLKIKYPAIIYDLADIETAKANNHKYLYNKRYTITLIHNDPDTVLVENLLEAFNYVDFDRNYKTNNLNHFVFDLFY